MCLLFTYIVNLGDKVEGKEEESGSGRSSATDDEKCSTDDSLGKPDEIIDQLQSNEVNPDPEGEESAEEVATGVQRSLEQTDETREESEDQGEQPHEEQEGSKAHSENERSCKTAADDPAPSLQRCSLEHTRLLSDENFDREDEEDDDAEGEVQGTLSRSTSVDGSNVLNRQAISQQLAHVYSPPHRHSVMARRDEMQKAYSTLIRLLRGNCEALKEQARA